MTGTRALSSSFAIVIVLLVVAGINLHTIA